MRHRRAGRRRGGGGREELAQLLGQRLGRVGQGLAFLDLGHQRAEHVDGREQDVGEGLDFVEGSASEGSEEVLHGVGEFRHPAMADRRGRALEGMRRSEYLVDHGGIEALLEDEQALFDPLDLLERFVRE